MNQNKGDYPNGSKYPQSPHNNGDQNVLLFVCVGLLVFVLMLGIIFVGVFLWRYTANSKAVSVPTTEATQTVSPTPSVSPSMKPSPTPRATPVPPAVAYLSSGCYLVNKFPNSGIYVRAQATTNSAQMAYINAGNTSYRMEYLDSLNSFDTNTWQWYTWHYVRLPNGNYGYVRSDVVSVYTSSSGSGNSKSYLVNAFPNSGIYVRSSASKDSSQIAFIAAGDTSVRMTYLGSTTAYDYKDGKNYTWYYVQMPNGVYGYVRSDVVRWW